MGLPAAQSNLSRFAPVLIAAALIAAGCSSTSDDTEGPAGTEAPTETTEAVDTTTSEPTNPAVEATFEVIESAEQLTIINAEPGHVVEAVGQDGRVGGTVDDLGNLILEEVPVGRNYTVTDVTADPPQALDGVRVPALTDLPEAGFYADQALEPGLNYIEMRDGTLLAAMVRLPGPIEDGPYPTVVEYSGYDPANPDEPEASTLIYGFLGYATVGVNMRGSGCSGGAFDYFEPLQSIDGYDAIEAIAAQPWVFGNKVGMVGISYPGISQLFVAATQPPSLAAITPLSVIEDLYRSVLYPGGIYNDGFAKSWGEERQSQTAANGQQWAVDRIAGGDTVCEDNQLLRSQNADLAAEAAARAFYDPAVDDRLSPRTFVDKIIVPTFMAGAFQDEQTGGRFSTMIDNFTGTEHLYVHLYNGAHADSASPEVLSRAVEFMDVYVAERTPQVPPIARAGAPGLYLDNFGEEGLELPPDRFTSLEEARSTIESEPPIRVLLEMGGNPQSLGGPLPRGEVSFDTWPPTEAEPTMWYLGEGGGLTAEPNNDGAGAAESFVFDPANGERVTPAADDDGNEFDNLAWAPLTQGNALAYETEPLADDVLIAGSGVVELWLASTADDADVQVTISEIRSDGLEMYIQSGWLRASHRVLDNELSTPLLPFHTHAASDAAPLPAGEFTPLQIEIFPTGHVLRAGSRLRLVIDSPGATRNLWKFDVLDQAETDSAPEHTISMTGARPSSITLPLVSGLDLPVGLAPCPNVRSQPCRPYVALTNTPSSGLPDTGE